MTPELLNEYTKAIGAVIAAIGAQVIGFYALRWRIRAANAGRPSTHQEVVRPEMPSEEQTARALQQMATNSNATSDAAMKSAAAHEKMAESLKDIERHQQGALAILTSLNARR